MKPLALLPISIIFLLLGQFPLLAQQGLRFEHLSERDGLSQNMVQSIYQDQEGFLWFGTYDGLNKYDGYTFSVFNTDPHDPLHTLTSNRVTDMLEDREGRFWVATYTGLDLLDK
jgi:ligand-binding sensor domain-containing protein